jgi:very-short-patch-repair endonuclease
MTEVERKLWARLRGKRIAGLRFRRQEAIGPYVADFYCSAAKLVVELDGGQHGKEENMAYDAARTRWLIDADYRVLRFSNRDFLHDPDVVVEGIWRAVAESGCPLPEALRASTLPQGEGRT